MAIAGLVVAVRIGSSGGDEGQNNDSDLVEFGTKFS